MEIRCGWATEYGSVKYDVSVHEADLTRILTAAGVSAARHSEVTSEEAWAIMDAEARWLAEHASARYLRGSGSSTAADRAAERATGAVKDRIDALKKLRKRLGLEGSSAD